MATWILRAAIRAGLLSAALAWAGGPQVESCLDGGRVRWIVPHGTGGGYDTFMRLLAPFYESRLGARLAVENVDEAGGLVGSLKISEAAPDGRTLGILNSTSLLTRRLSGEAGIPNLATDFTLLARVDRSCHVWATGSGSEFRTMDDVFRVAARRPLVLGLREVGVSSFASFAIGADLLRLPYEMVAGFSGSREALLSAMRGEVDLVSYNFESIVKELEAGDIRPLLQISDRAIAEHPVLKGVPLLAGPGGLAAKRAQARGGDGEAAAARALALAQLVGAGRLIAGPPGMDPARAACLRQALEAALADPKFLAVAGQHQIVLEVAGGEQACGELMAIEKQLDLFRPIVKEAISKVRQ